MKKFTFSILAFGFKTAVAGPFSPAANQVGTNAISKDDSKISRWANRVISYSPGADVDAQWQDSKNALGKASGEAFDIVSLGRGGSITLGFSEPIRNQPGPDFAVFENSLSHRFLELAFVEVSSDGVNFTRFPNRSLTSTKVGSFGESDPTNIDGLAGKFIGGFGTPFDLSALAGSPNLNIDSITQVRIIDIAGDGLALDSQGSPIYDPHPTFSSAGFDLDGLAVLDAAPLSVVKSVLKEQQLEVTWALNPNLSHQLHFSADLGSSWTSLETIPSGTVYLTKKLPLAGSQGFWRVTPQAMNAE